MRLESHRDSLVVPQVSTLRALEVRDTGYGRVELQGKLRLLPSPVQDVIKVGL